MMYNRIVKRHTGDDFMTYEELFEEVLKWSQDFQFQFDRLDIHDQTKAFVLGEWSACEELLDYIRENWGRISVENVLDKVSKMKTKSTGNPYFRVQAFEKGYQEGWDILKNARLQYNNV